MVNQKTAPYITLAKARGFGRDVGVLILHNGGNAQRGANMDDMTGKRRCFLEPDLIRIECGDFVYLVWAVNKIYPTLRKAIEEKDAEACKKIFAELEPTGEWIYPGDSRHCVYVEQGDCASDEPFLMHIPPKNGWWNKK